MALTSSQETTDEKASQRTSPTESLQVLQSRFSGAQLGCIDAAHRVQARVEDRIRTGKDCGIGRFPSHNFAINSAWLAAALIPATLLSWLRLIALDSTLARAEPKALRRILHTAGKLVRGGRRRRLKIPATWPWANTIAAAWARITALPQAP